LFNLYTRCTVSAGTNTDLVIPSALSTKAEWSKRVSWIKTKMQLISFTMFFGMVYIAGETKQLLCCLIYEKEISRVAFAQRGLRLEAIVLPLC
jgi:hypothetical protein